MNHLALIASVINRALQDLPVTQRAIYADLIQIHFKLLGESIEGDANKIKT